MNMVFMSKDKGKRIFFEDLVIKQALLDRDRKVTTEFYYKGCFPIFQSLWKKYETDCESPFELMNQIYMLMLCPSKKTGKCQLENYRGESTLRSWIKTVALFYCYKVYGNRSVKKIDDVGDRLDMEKQSLDDARVINTDNSVIERMSFAEMDMSNIVKGDLMRLISLMPNRRYAEVMRLYLIEHRTNEEVAYAFGVRMPNLYNLHGRAEEQFEAVCRREGLYE